MYQVNTRISNEAQTTTPTRLQFQYMLASVDIETVDTNQVLQMIYIIYHLQALVY